ncbi:MAG: hypothetical protein ACYDEQ_09225 [Desulfocucumaceae bacterium]
MSGFNDWLRSVIGGTNETKGPVKITRKKMWWLVVAVMLGICLITLGNLGAKPAEEKDKNISLESTVNTDTDKKTKMLEEEESLAARLKAMLEGIEGSGTVKVTVRLAASARESYALNKTTGSKNTVEKDQGGGTRTINENTDSAQLVIAKNGKGDAPVVELESSSKVSGVLVVAEGASSPRVKERLFEAVRVALNVDPHKILVLPGEGGTH